MKKLAVLILYVVSCGAGTLFECLWGWILRYATGQFIWIYQDSPLQTTSLIVIPLWGVAGLMFYGIGRAINKLVR